ncbi:hypothetical protein KQH56_02445 [bacterium]|nr:hypothetical protein [bacterium]
MIRLLWQYFILLFNPLFDKDYYVNTYKDVKDSSINPLLHFLRDGWREGRNPSKLFNTRYYLSKNPDVKEKGINPLIHFIRHGRREGRNPLPKGKNEIPDRLGGNGSLRIKVSTNGDNEYVRNEQGGEPFLDNDNVSDGPDIFLHVGQGKTGTSAIQNFLDVNRHELFEKYSCLYPNLMDVSPIEGRSHNHEKWYKNLKNKNESIVEDLRKLKEFSSHNLVKKIILSFEGWDLDPQFQHEIYNAIKRLDFGQIRVIYYIRRVDHLVQSSWKQWGILKFERIEDYCSLRHFTEKYSDVFDYLSEWVKLIGKNNVILRPYEQEQLQEGLLSNFLSVLGIRYQPDEWKPNEDVYYAKNPGFSRDVIELFNICKHLYKYEEKLKLFDFFYRELGEDFQKKPFEEYAFLSPEQRLSLLYSNIDYEYEIARKFLNRDKIFFEEWPNIDDPWKPYEGLTLEKALPILIKLIENNKN